MFLFEPKQIVNWKSNPSNKLQINWKKEWETDYPDYSYEESKQNIIGGLQEVWEKVKNKMLAKKLVNTNLFNGDFFKEIKKVEDNSIDLVLNDPPYGTTAIKWDSILDFNKMWDELDRVTTDT